MISFQTNVASMVADQNLQVNTNFQTKTIEQLTSGYRINTSADDAAGLAVANGYTSKIAEVTQGVLNANQANSQLQIIDGGLGNISTILNRLSTLATESASSTFTGDRTTLNTEYQTLLGEINRQSNNIGLGATDTTNIKTLGVYVGGGSDASNSTVNVDLTNSGVNATALGLTNTSILTNAAVKIGTVAAVAIATADTATFKVETATGVSNFTVTGQAGDTLQSQLAELNTDLSGTAIQASLNAAGVLQFQSASAFSVSAIAGTAPNLAPITTAATANNTGLNTQDVAQGAGAGTLTITEGGTVVTANVAGIVPAQSDIASINAALQTQGITDVTAVLDLTAGTPPGISFQGSGNFTVTEAAVGGYTGAISAPTTATVGGDPNVAINAILAAIQSLGTTQGKVGTGENTLNYAINLAQSQITNFSAAESQIRDANVAVEAANLTKASVLQQSSIAAMAQANSAPQALLKLFQ